MTGALTLITPMLARLIPRLSSPFEGERLATLAAIERMLKAKGLDFNDLAASLNRPEPAPPAEPPCSYSCSPDPDGRRRDLARANRLLLAVERLSLKEQSFLINVRQILLGGRPLSPKQSDWLADIHARAGREFA